jgi:hypothetical protein
VSDLHASRPGTRRIGDSETRQSFVYGWIVLCLVFIACALLSWGAREVRGDLIEVGRLTFLGLFWLLAALALFSWLGLSMSDDFVERGNSAAGWAISSALLAVALTFAGGNFGEGPSCFENVFSAALGTGGLFGLWLVLELAARVSVSITEERDEASGLRLGGFLLASGLILGRAVAGDWHSVSETLHDFVADGWPALLLLAIAVVSEWFLRPSRLRPFPKWSACGLVPALAYLAFAVVCLVHLGRWEGMPK